MAKNNRQWQKGPCLTPLEALAEICEGRPVYWNDRWTHNGWARSWQIAMVMGDAGRGAISKAIKIEEEPE